MHTSHEQAARHPVKRLVACYAVVACATVVAFWSSLDNGFLPWDDDIYVSNNPDITALGLTNVTRVFSSSYSSNYQPLTMLSYMVDFRLFGWNAKGYHATNLVLHVINGLLVFALAMRLSRRRKTSLVVALLFAVHPLRVESVAWIAERKDVLSALFYLLSLYLYARRLQEGRARLYWLCLLSLLLSLLSKPMAVSQPIVLLLMDYLYGRRLDRNNLIDKIPFFALAFLFAATALFTQRSGGAVQSFFEVPILQRLCVPFYGLVFYLAKALVPVRFCALYPLPPELPTSAMYALYTAPLLVLGGAVLLYRFRAFSRPLVFGSLFYLVTLLPVLQIVPIGNAMVAERYSYLPLLGPCLALASLFRFLFAPKLCGRVSRSLVGVGFAAAIVVLGGITYHRCGSWRNGFTLWNDVLAKYPSAVAYGNRGQSYLALGMFDRAIEDLDRAISLSPEYFEAYDNRGFAHISKGEYDLAIEDHTRALRLNPKDAIAYNNRALAYRYKGDYARAVEDLSTAIGLKPTAVAYSNRGASRNAMGDYRRAIEDFTESTRLNPEYKAAFFNRGLAYHALGDEDQALRDFGKACALGHHLACQRLARK